MEHEKPAQPPPPNPDAARDDVRVAANRCPYCHDSVSREDDAWVSCRECLTRHHTACWEEAEACSSCGEVRFLAEQGGLPPDPVQQGPVTHVAPRRSEGALEVLLNAGYVGRALVAFLLVVLTVVGLVAAEQGKHHDGALGFALAAAALLGALGTALGARASTVFGGFLATLGAGFLVAAPFVDDASDVQASRWAGGAFFCLGALVLAWARVRARRRR